jgi:hypothetical protein
MCDPAISFDDLGVSGPKSIGRLLRRKRYRPPTFYVQSDRVRPLDWIISHPYRRDIFVTRIIRCGWLAVQFGDFNLPARPAAGMSFPRDIHTGGTIAFIEAVWSKNPISPKRRDIGRLPSIGTIPTLQGHFLVM